MKWQLLAWVLWERLPLGSWLGVIIRVLAIDQYEPPHALGSSHGDTRITRELYNTGAEIDLARRSHQIWREIESLTGEKLFTISGGLFIGNEEEQVGRAWIDSLIERAKSHDVEYEEIDPSDLRKRFPTFRIAGHKPALYEPNAGILKPELCIDTQIKLARETGADIHFGEQVQGVDPVGDQVNIRTTANTYQARQVVITTGAWIGAFLPENLKSAVGTYRQVLHWFEIERNYEALSSMPVFVWQAGTDDHDMFYGFPAVDGSSGGLKLAGEQYESESDPDQIDRVVNQEEIDTMFKKFAYRIEGLSPRSLRTATCMYTVTKDWNYILDRHPDAANVFLASPCMGRGFKHSAAIGEAIAQIMVDGSSDISLKQFAITDRF